MSSARFAVANESVVYKADRPLIRGAGGSCLMLNNREWATLFWLAVVGAWAITQRDIRSSLGDVLRTAIGPKIFVPLAFMAAWVLFEVWLGEKLKLWVPSLGKDTVIWFVASWLVLFFNFEYTFKKPHFFQRKAVAALGPLVLLEVLVDDLVFPLPAEILLQPIVAFLVLLSVVAGEEERHRCIKKLADGLMGLTGLVLLTYVILKAITGWHELDKGDLLLQVMLPVWLTLGLLPFIYVVALYAAYEQAFLLIDWKSEASRKNRLRSKLVLLLCLHFRGRDLASFNTRWAHLLASASSFSEAQSVIRDLHSARREAARAEREAKELLIRFAGVDGVDEDGKRLDRREFEETTRSLRWLATCMMGWYRRGNRYQADLLHRLGDDFTGNGLGKPSGITMHVAKNGQAWYAWRRTVSGWCFAIGAAGPPPDQWEYDGPEPPSGFPGQDRLWGSNPFSDERNPNW